MTAARAWAKENLFRTRRDVVITIVSGIVVGFIVFRFARFLAVTGRWEIVRANLTLFLVGRYPRTELWRPVVAVLAVAGTAGLLSGVGARRRERAAALAGTATPRPPWPVRLRSVVVAAWPAILLVVVLLLLTSTFTPTVVAAGAVATIAVGRLLGRLVPAPLGPWLYLLVVLLPVPLLVLLTGPLGWDNWGGLMLTLFIAAVSMLACFPLGLLLALGRRSTLPAIAVLCITIIEFFRGIPLVVLVLMSDVALGFFFPQALLPGKVVRVMVAFTIFTAAYVAEVVRGGLQSLPKGQMEAAQALGLSPTRTMALVILPQALRNVIPALVGQFISLFKDTTLVFIIGFLDVLTVADNITKQPEFAGASLYPEALFFAAALFWVGAFTLSRAAGRLEGRLGVGTR